MMTLAEIKDAVSTHRWYVVGAVVLGLMGWGTSFVIDAMNPLNAMHAQASAANVAPAAPPPPPAASLVPNWATTEPPVPETPFFPPIPPPDTNVEKSAEVRYKEYVHRQASYLRKMAQDPAGRRTFGNLTPDQIDDMEKNGVTIQ
jgi:hypothetical protein